MRIAVPRGQAFLAVNAAALLAVIGLIAALVTARFENRRAAMAEQAEELSRIEGAKLRTAALAKQIAGRGNPFLGATDERVGSADLQAILQDIVRQTGANFLSVRGLPAPRRPDVKLVAAKIDLEGPLDRIDAVVKAVESHVPLLWIDTAAIKDAGTGQEPGMMLHAELQVQAALAPGARTGPSAPSSGDGLGIDGTLRR